MYARAQGQCTRVSADMCIRQSMSACVTTNMLLFRHCSIYIAMYALRLWVVRFVAKHMKLYYSIIMIGIAQKIVKILIECSLKSP